LSELIPSEIFEKDCGGVGGKKYNQIFEKSEFRIDNSLLFQNAEQSETAYDPNTL
jgi:hypothetical protein